MRKSSRNWVERADGDFVNLDRCHLVGVRSVRREGAPYILAAYEFDIHGEEVEHVLAEFSGDGAQGEAQRAKYQLMHDMTPGFPEKFQLEGRFS